MNVVAPSGVVTFLFTDIEGSTRRWDTDADGMRTALAAHDALLRETVEAHQWLVVQAHRRRRVRGVRLTPRGGRRRGGRAAGARTTRADGDRDRRGGAARRGLLRRGPEPCRAGDGGGAWRPDTNRRRDSGAPHRGRPADLGAASTARHRQAGHRLPGLRRRCAHRFPTTEDTRPCTGKPAASNHHLPRTRGRDRRRADGAEGAPAGDADRCPAGSARPGSRSRSPCGWPTSSPTECG